MRLTARALNRATLERQLLLERSPLELLAAVKQLAAIQAQEPASPYVGLWNRLAGLDPAQLDAAFEERSLVRSSLLRITLHAVHADDHPAYYRAMLPSLRAARLNDRRFTESGLTTEEVDGVLPEFLDLLATPRTSDEITAWLAGRFGEAGRWAWWALRTYAPVRRAPTGEAWAFGARTSFVAADTGDVDGGQALTAAAAPEPSAPDGTAVSHLLLRYLRAFGPASLRDFGQFSLLRQAAIKPAVAELGEQLIEVEGPGGAVLYDIAGLAVPPEDTPAPPRLLPMWDSVLLAYADRSRVIPPAYRPLVIRRNGDTLPTLLVDGLVAGVWRPVEGGVELTAFEPLAEAVWAALATEASALHAFLAGREPLTYSRYGYWWKQFAGFETRLVQA